MGDTAADRASVAYLGVAHLARGVGQEGSVLDQVRAGRLEFDDGLVTLFLSCGDHIATMIDANDPEDIQKVVDNIDDPAGTFYRFSLPGSILRRKII